MQGLYHHDAHAGAGLRHDAIAPVQEVGKNFLKKGLRRGAEAGLTECARQYQRAERRAYASWSRPSCCPSKYLDNLVCGVTEPFSACTVLPVVRDMMCSSCAYDTVRWDRGGGRPWVKAGLA